MLVCFLFRELAHVKEEKDRMLSEKQAEFDHMLDVSIRSQKALVVEVRCHSSSVGFLYGLDLKSG